MIYRIFNTTLDCAFPLPGPPHDDAVPRPVVVRMGEPEPGTDIEMTRHLPLNQIVPRDLASTGSTLYKGLPDG